MSLLYNYFSEEYIDEFLCNLITLLVICFPLVSLALLIYGTLMAETWALFVVSLPLFVVSLWICLGHSFIPIYYSWEEGEDNPVLCWKMKSRCKYKDKDENKKKVEEEEDVEKKAE